MRAVRETFERRRARGQAGKISSLAYCVSAVEERWEMERRGLVGKEDGPPAAAADAAAIRDRLASLVAGLRAVGEEERKDLLRRGEDSCAPSIGEAATFDLEVLRKGLEKAAARVEDIGPDLPFEEIEKRLSSIEASLVRTGLKAMNSSSPSSLSLVESRVSDALGDVAGLSPHVVERMRAALTRREVRALAGFPPLTLLHG
ncbi:MAG: hypothetical protein ABI584_02685 [Acidobacteriota bacterium]